MLTDPRLILTPSPAIQGRTLRVSCERISALPGDQILVQSNQGSAEYTQPIARSGATFFITSRWNAGLYRVSYIRQDTSKVVTVPFVLLGDPTSLETLAITHQNVAGCGLHLRTASSKGSFFLRVTSKETATQQLPQCETPVSVQFQAVERKPFGLKGASASDDLDWEAALSVEAPVGSEVLYKGEAKAVVTSVKLCILNQSGHTIRLQACTSPHVRTGSRPPSACLLTTSYINAPDSPPQTGNCVEEMTLSSQPQPVDWWLPLSVRQLVWEEVEQDETSQSAAFKEFCESFGGTYSTQWEKPQGCGVVIGPCGVAMTSVEYQRDWAAKLSVFLKVHNYNNQAEGVLTSSAAGVLYLQTPLPVVRQVCRFRGELYQDADFPPERASVVGFDDDIPLASFEQYQNDIQWLRPHELIDVIPRLFLTNEDSFGDTRHGVSPVTLWYSHIISAVATVDQHLIQKLFIPTTYDKYYGAYTCSMCVASKVIHVLIDDRIPTYLPVADARKHQEREQQQAATADPTCVVNKKLLSSHAHGTKIGAPLFCNSPHDGCEIWQLLLEKVLAKWAGSYAVLQQGPNSPYAKLKPADLLPALVHPKSGQPDYDYYREIKLDSLKDKRKEYSPEKMDDLFQCLALRTTGRHVVISWGVETALAVGLDPVAIYHVVEVVEVPMPIPIEDILPRRPYVHVTNGTACEVWWRIYHVSTNASHLCEYTEYWTARHDHVHKFECDVHSISWCFGNPETNPFEARETCLVLLGQTVNIEHSGIEVEEATLPQNDTWSWAPLVLTKLREENAEITENSQNQENTGNSQNSVITENPENTGKLRFVKLKIPYGITKKLQLDTYGGKLDQDKYWYDRMWRGMWAAGDPLWAEFPSLQAEYFPNFARETEEGIIYLQWEDWIEKFTYVAWSGPHRCATEPAAHDNDPH